MTPKDTTAGSPLNPWNMPPNTNGPAGPFPPSLPLVPFEGVPAPLPVMLGAQAAWEEEVKFQDLMFPGWREWTKSFVSNALAGEGGEFTEVLLRFQVAQGKVSNLAKKLDGGGTNKVKSITPEVVIEELADVYIYLILLAELLGHNGEQFGGVVLKKIAKNYDRMKPKEWV